MRRNGAAHTAWMSVFADENFTTGYLLLSGEADCVVGGPFRCGKGV
jgi:hypothetical protein